MLDIAQLEACVANGGLFGLIIPPVAALLLVIELLWLFWVVTRELLRRSDLRRVRDLVIEGSLGQAILISDQRSKDDLLAVCRAGIVTVQSAGALDQAMEKIEQEAAFRFGPRSALLRTAVLVLLASAPLLLAIGSRAYAERVVNRAAATIPERDRPALIAQGHDDPAFSCPADLGVTGTFALAPPALLIGLIVSSRRSERARRQSIQEASTLAEMAFRVGSHNAYRQERERARG